jgi:hypothetical protein
MEAMNFPRNPDAFEKFPRLVFRAFECVVTAVLGVFLILAWILASPLLRFGVYLSDLHRMRLNSKKEDGYE